MKNTFRALFGVSALAFLLVAAPVFAAEVNVTGENHLTGESSENENEWDVDNDLDVDVDNDGDVDNKADADVNTGGNDQEENTTAGDLETGTVDASTDWESIVNAGAELGAVGGDLDVTADFINDTTGHNSENENELDVDHDVDLDLDNMADIFNYLHLHANTGWNDQEKNTEAGNMDTGDISLESFISNWANNDSGFAGAGHDGVSVDVLAENHLTGAHSENENKVDVDNDFDLDIDNDADIDNKIKVNANTGKNDQEKNTTGGSITTGSIDVYSDVVNSANNGGSMSASGGNSVSVTADLTNDTTGHNSENENKVDVDNDVDVDIDNNADVENELEVEANTGYNDQEENTTGGNIDTGDVSITFNVSNEVNGD